MPLPLAGRLLRWYASCDFPKGTYSGARVALLPPDFLLSWLAKRSYPMYRVWDRWADLTRIAFPANSRPAGETPERFTFDESLVRTLRQDGVASIPDAFPPAWVDEAREYILERFRRTMARLESMSDRADPSVSWYDEDGVYIDCIRNENRYRFGFPTDPGTRDRFPRPIADFMRLPVTHHLIESYFGMAVTSCRPYCIAEVLVPAGVSDRWHIDCLRKGVKAFLYLTDVTEAQGPLHYVLGSHVADGVHHRQLYRVGRSGPSAGYYTERANIEFDAKATRVTGPANTLILFDNRGIHRGSPCSQGIRVVLVNGFRPAYSTRINPIFLPHLSPLETNAGGSN